VPVRQWTQEESGCGLVGRVTLCAPVFAVVTIGQTAGREGLSALPFSNAGVLEGCLKTMSAPVLGRQFEPLQITSQS